MPCSPPFSQLGRTLRGLRPPCDARRKMADIKVEGHRGRQQIVSALAGALRGILGLTEIVTVHPCRTTTKKTLQSRSPAASPQTRHPRHLPPTASTAKQTKAAREAMRLTASRATRALVQVLRARVAATRAGVQGARVGPPVAGERKEAGPVGERLAEARAGPRREAVRQVAEVQQVEVAVRRRRRRRAPVERLASQLTVTSRLRWPMAKSRSR
mmetsp:Transcript_54973/g.151279  ORF Transcript_54973/g.151279 Transcript_54973/m.151279 type:complete len:214 (-) Transcript_54973:2109-2750(-)